MLQCHNQQIQETNNYDMIHSFDHTIKCGDRICNERDRSIDRIILSFNSLLLSLLPQPKVFTIVGSRFRCVRPRSRSHSRLGWFGS